MDIDQFNILPRFLTVILIRAFKFCNEKLKDSLGALEGDDSNKDMWCRCGD